MCYMVVVALPPKMEDACFARLPEGMRHWSADYEELKQSTNGWPLRVVGTSICSCDLYKPRKDYEEWFRHKCQKRGWSNAKIDRALAERKDRGFQGGLHPDIRRWLAEAAEEAGGIYLLVHWEGTEVVPMPIERVSSGEFASESMVVLEERLYYIKKDVG
jgi:hypothetical protein